MAGKVQVQVFATVEVRPDGTVALLLDDAIDFDFVVDDYNGSDEVTAVVAEADARLDRNGGAFDYVYVESVHADPYDVDFVEMNLVD